MMEYHVLSLIMRCLSHDYKKSLTLMGLTQSEKPLKEAFKAIRDTGPCSLWSRSHQNIFRSWEISSANDHLSSEEQPQTTPKLGSTVTVAL